MGDDIMDDVAIKQIWNRFSPEQRNMSFVEFHREMKRMTDPNRMRQDLAVIQRRKRLGEMNKRRIDRTIR